MVAPSEKKMFARRALSTTANQLRSTVRAWCAAHVEPQALEHDRDERFNRALFEKFGEDLGVNDISFEDDHSVPCVIAEELSYRDPGFCLSWMAHSVLFVHNLRTNAKNEKQKTIAPKVGAMCMSEPGAGTDVLGMTTTAVRDGDCFVLNGQKMWITNGGVADALLVYAKVEGDITLFLVEDGWQSTPIQGKCGMRSSPTALVFFDDCRVSADNVVGEVGRGAKAMMRNLHLERLVLAAMSVGIARRCLDVARHYASDRHAFGSNLIQFGQIQRHLAESYAEMSAARAYLYEVASSASATRVESDGVKLFAAKIATKGADRAMQVLGGNGYVADYAVERLWRDAKLLEIGGGTLESHQKNIANDLHRFYRDSTYI